jgi:hypothetical protein
LKIHQVYRALLIYKVKTALGIAHFVRPCNIPVRIKQDNALQIVTSQHIPFNAINATLDASIALDPHYKNVLNATIIHSHSATLLVFVIAVQVFTQI